MCEWDVDVFVMVCEMVIDLSVFIGEFMMLIVIIEFLVLLVSEIEMCDGFVKCDMWYVSLVELFECGDLMLLLFAETCWVFAATCALTASYVVVFLFVIGFGLMMF